MEATLRHLGELNDISSSEVEAREQFRRTIDEDVRAEFIDGKVIVQMTVRDKHATTVRNIGRLLDIFVETRRLGVVRTEQALTGFSRNDYAPDICFWTMAKSSVFHGGTTIYPVPDFIAEVLSPSTELQDRGVKFEDYATHGVGEYWIIDPDNQTVEQYTLLQNRYELTGKQTSGEIKSVVVEGFNIPVQAIFDDQVNRSPLREFLA